MGIFERSFRLRKPSAFESLKRLVDNKAKGDSAIIKIALALLRCALSGFSLPGSCGRSGRSRSFADESRAIRKLSIDPTRDTTRSREGLYYLCQLKIWCGCNAAEARDL